MSYGSRKWGLWPRGGLTSLRLRRITSSPSQTRRTPRWMLDACRRSSRLCFSHFATRTVDNTVDLYAAKPDIRPESRFLPTPPAFDAPVRGFPSEYCHPVWCGKTRMVGLPEGEKISKISLFVWTWSTNVSDRQTHRQWDRHTDTAWRHRPRLCIALRGKNGERELIKIVQLWRLKLGDTKTIFYNTTWNCT